MSTHDWQPYHGEYRKQEYDVRLRDGREVIHCWPNAGKFNQMKKPHETVDGEQVTHVRYSVEAHLMPEDYPWPTTHPDDEIGENDKD